MSARKNYYEILGVSSSADAAEIRKQYKKLCLTHHPDKGGSEEAFQSVQKAYEVLSDERKKSIYDQTGADPDEQMSGQGPVEMDLGNMFANMFGGGGFNPFSGQPMPRQKRNKPTPKMHEISVSLYDFYHGKQLKVQFERSRFCTGCKGNGSKTTVKCNDCQGRGMVENIMMMGPGMHAISRGPCMPCKGLGKVASGTCDTCKGKKFFNQEKVLDIHIEPGMKPGDTVVFPCVCSDSLDYEEAGDVHIIFQEADETYNLKRDKDDLHTVVSISLKESLLGTSFVIMNHPKYKEGYTVVIPAGTQHMETVVVVGEGMAKRNSKHFGNLCILTKVVVTRDDKKCLEKNKEILESLFSSTTPL